MTERQIQLMRELIIIAESYAELLRAMGRPLRMLETRIAEARKAFNL